MIDERQPKTINLSHLLTIFHPTPLFKGKMKQDKDCYNEVIIVNRRREPRSPEGVDRSSSRESPWSSPTRHSGDVSLRRRYQDTWSVEYRRETKESGSPLSTKNVNGRDQWSLKRKVRKSEDCRHIGLGIIEERQTL